MYLRHMSVMSMAAASRRETNSSHSFVPSTLGACSVRWLTLIRPESPWPILIIRQQLLITIPAQQPADSFHCSRSGWRCAALS